MAIDLVKSEGLLACLEHEVSSSLPTWLQQLQAEQKQAFLEKGLPTRRNEFWKYTDVTYLAKESYVPSSVVETAMFRALAQERRLSDTPTICAVFVNGHFCASLSDLNLLPAGVVLCSLKQAIKQHADLVQKALVQSTLASRYPFVQLNLAMLDDGLFIYIPKNTAVHPVIQCLYLMTGADAVVNTLRNIVIADESSEASLLEEYVAVDAARYLTNVVTDVQLAANAKFQHYKIQDEGEQATHIAQVMVNQLKDSRLKSVNLAVGSRMDREDVQVNLREQGAECSVNGFYALDRDGLHVDNHLQIDHMSTHGVSDMVYKGILNKKSHAVFNGMVYVHPLAQKTQAHQVNHNLLLSKEAAIDTKPEFEIYADDVKCMHGDTVGQLDNEALFYLQSRGIAREEGLRLLAQAFSSEVIDKVDVVAVAERMRKLLKEKGL